MERNEIVSYVTNALKMTEAFLDRYGPNHEVDQLLHEVDQLLKDFYFDLNREQLIPESSLNTNDKDWFKAQNENLVKLLNEQPMSPVQSERLTKTADDLIQLIERESAKLSSQITKQMMLVYEQQRDEAKQWFRFTLIAAALGFIIIVAGIIFILLLARGPNYLGYITAGIVTSISGVVINVISTLFLRQSNNANKQANSTLEKLDIYERFQISTKILSSFKTDAKSHTKSP